MIIKKADIILALALVLIGLGSTLGLAFSQTPGETVKVTVGGELYGTYDLWENRDITIRQNDKVNILSIRDGSVYMQAASCHNQQCVKQGSISQASQTIVCLPNQVFVNIEGTDSPFDGVAY